MVKEIDRTDLLSLIEENGQIVDVLPQREYEEAHIPEALNIPLRQLDETSTAGLLRDLPVVVYCHDGL